MIANRVHELAGKRCDAAEALKKIQRNAFGFENRTRKRARFHHDIAGNYGFAICANDLNIRRRIDLPKNLCGSPSSGNDRWFMRNDSCAGMECFGNEKLGSDVAFAYVFLKRCSDRIVIVRVHGRSGARTIPT